MANMSVHGPVCMSLRAVKDGWMLYHKKMGDVVFIIVV